MLFYNSFPILFSNNKNFKMKNFKLIALCAILFATQQLSAQFAVYTEGYGAGATFAEFGGSTNNVTEDMTMANAHTGTKSLRAEVPTGGYTGGAIKAATTQNLTAYTAVTFWVRASASKTLNVTGFANNATAAPHQTEKVNIPVSTTWTKVTITIPNPAILTAEDGLFHFAEGSDEGAYTLWFDDIQYENIAVVGDPAPATAAPTPTRAVANVISLFSGSPYTDLMGTNWNPYHGTTGYSEVPIATNTTQKYTNLDYSVSEAASNIDLTAYSGFHVDFWSATAVNFKVKLVDFGADGAYGGGDDKEGEVDKGTQAAGSWVSLDILLSDFAAAGFTTKAHFRQLVISTSSASPIVYLDNLYFYKPTVVLPTEPMTAAPTPTRPAANVISLFSDASGYTNVAGTDFFPNWGQSTVVADVMVASNPTKKYTTMNYQGIQFATFVNASAMTNLHFDLWTPNCTAFEVSLINTSPGTVEQAVTVTPTLSGWNSFDIPLSSYTTVNKTIIGQIKLVATPFGSSTVYLDNIYFWKPAAIPVESRGNPARISIING